MATMVHATAVLAVALVLAVGACLLDGNELAGHDLCLAFLALSHSPDLGSPLGLTGALAPVPTPGLPLVRLDRPIPPPRA